MWYRRNQRRGKYQYGINRGEIMAATSIISAKVMAAAWRGESVASAGVMAKAIALDNQI
jgi:hypothetical protein